MNDQILTIEQENQVYANRRTLMEKANEQQFFLQFLTLKLPAKIAGFKLQYPVAYAGNYCTQISWNLVERIATGEVKIIQ